MKILSLNTWGGRAGKDKLLQFIEKNKQMDIFCLQEIWSTPYEHLEGKAAGGTPIDHENIMVYGLQEISVLLDSHLAFFRPHHLDNYGLLMLVKKDMKLIAEGDIFVYKEKGYIPDGDVGFHARNLQFATIATTKGNRTVLNFHGLWNGGGKGDSEDRLIQSEKIIHFIDSLNNPIVMCGDFNMSPETQSLKTLENYGLRNLIKENGVTSTRTRYYNKPEKFADYVMVSQEIVVNEFKVLPDVVSDHSPLYLDFE